MIRLNCDYCKGALPEVLEALQTINDQAFCGYGCDEVCERAARLIRERAGVPSADVHFLVGGTQANFVVIESALRPWQSVICADSGHINVHETGAVEATGHKVLPCAAKDGKVTPEGVEAVCALHTDEHMVAPRLLYISQPTEIGTVYHLDELKALRRVCDAHGLILFVDGARLGSALLASCPELVYSVSGILFRFLRTSDSLSALWRQLDSTLFNTVFQATGGRMRVTLDDGRSILATGEMLRDLADRLLALAYRRMDVSPTLTDALYDLSRAGSFAAMRELVSRFPMDENERAWIIQMLRENGQTE